MKTIRQLFEEKIALSNVKEAFVNEDKILFYALFTDDPYESNFSDGNIGAVGPFASKAAAGAFEDTANNELDEVFRGFIFGLSGSGKFIGFQLDNSDDEPIEAKGPFADSAAAKKAVKNSHGYETRVAKILSTQEFGKWLKKYTEE